MAEVTGMWPTLSPDPVIQWCAVEALSRRLIKVRADEEAHDRAVAGALARAEAEVRMAVGR